jgi:hypothetical protein
MRGYASPVERRIRLWILLLERSRKPQRPAGVPPAS